jgi:hypothetical protein
VRREERREKREEKREREREREKYENDTEEETEAQLLTFCNLTEGSLEMTPVPVQGASNKTRSKPKNKQKTDKFFFKKKKNPTGNSLPPVILGKSAPS